MPNPEVVRARMPVVGHPAFDEEPLSALVNGNPASNPNSPLLEQTLVFSTPPIVTFDQRRIDEIQSDVSSDEDSPVLSSKQVRRHPVSDSEAVRRPPVPNLEVVRRRLMLSPEVARRRPVPSPEVVLRRPVAAQVVRHRSLPNWDVVRARELAIGDHVFVRASVGKFQKNNILWPGFIINIVPQLTRNPYQAQYRYEL